MTDDQADGGAGAGALSRRPEERRRRAASSPAAGRSSATATSPGSARRCSGARDSVPDLARPQRADHGACRHRLCQAARPPAGDGGDLLHRAGRHQHGDGRGAGACQPPAGALLPGDVFANRGPDPGAAAGRGFRRRHGLGQRLLPPGQPLFRPHHAARAAADRPAARVADDDRSGRLRPGDAAFCQDVQAEAYD